MTLKFKIHSAWPFYGMVLWLLLIAMGSGPELAPKSIGWVLAILLLAPLVLIPWALQLINAVLPFSERVRGVVFLAAICVGLAFALPSGLLAAILSLPWFVITIFLARSVLKTHLASSNSRSWSIRCQASGFLFLPIGAAAAFANRLGVEPLEFTPIIILLTTVHFHYAGFFLPLLTSWALRSCVKPNLCTKSIAIGIISGVPLVGLGITTSQLGFPPWIETASVSVLALAAIGSALVQLKNALRHSSVCLFISALALLLGMALALCYGWRHYFPISFLSIPWMYAVHGTLNSIGFAALGVVGWWRVKKSPAEAGGLGLGQGKG